MKKMKKTKTSTSVALSPRADPSRQFCSSPSRPGRSGRERASRKASQRCQTTKKMIRLIAHSNADFRLASPKEFANLCSQVNFKVCKCFTIALQKNSSLCANRNRNSQLDTELQCECGMQKRHTDNANNTIAMERDSQIKTYSNANRTIAMRIQFANRDVQINLVLVNIYLRIAMRIQFINGGNANGIHKLKHMVMRIAQSQCECNLQIEMCR